MNPQLRTGLAGLQSCEVVSAELNSTATFDPINRLLINSRANVHEYPKFYGLHRSVLPTSADRLNLQKRSSVTLTTYGKTRVNHPAVELAATLVRIMSFTRPGRELLLFCSANLARLHGTASAPFQPERLSSRKKILSRWRRKQHRGSGSPSSISYPSLVLKCNASSSMRDGDYRLHQVLASHIKKFCRTSRCTSRAPPTVAI